MLAEGVGGVVYRTGPIVLAEGVGGGCLQDKGLLCSQMV